MIFKSVAYFQDHSCGWLAAVLWLTSAATAHAADVSIHIQVTPRWVEQVAIERPRQTVIYHEPARVYYPHVSHQPTTEVRYFHAPTQLQPILIHAPKKHRRHWKKYCHRYQACGRQVQFVERIESRNTHQQTREHYGSDQGYAHEQQRYQVREEHRHFHRERH